MIGGAFGGSGATPTLIPHTRIHHFIREARMAVVKKTVPRLASDKKPLSVAAPVASKFALPTAPSTPSSSIGDYSMLLFGDKKVGKTTLASLFPAAYFLMTEPGAKALSVYQTPVTEWSTFQSAIRALTHDTRFRTVVVDTVDLAFKQCERAVCRRMGIDHPSEEDWGKGWAGVRDEFTTTMQQLLLLDKGIIFISHATEREISTRSGQRYDRIQPTMPNQARDIIEGLVDIWAYYTYMGRERVLIIRGDEHISAGHRLQDNFRAPDGRELTHVHMGTSPRQGYTNLMAAFANTYRPPQDGKSVADIVEEANASKPPLRRSKRRS
jgi:hypothetical protein